MFLEVHAAAEEEIFYPELVKLALGPRPLARAEPETLDAIYDHNEIRDAIAAVRPHRVGSPDWRDAIAAVNVANGDHMAEEEREGLTDFRRWVSLPAAPRPGRAVRDVRGAELRRRAAGGQGPAGVRAAAGSGGAVQPAGWLAPRRRLVWFGRIAWDRRPEALAALGRTNAYPEVLCRAVGAEGARMVVDHRGN